MLDRLNELDTDLFLWLNGFHSEFWDRMMWFVSGKIEWLPLYLVLLGYLIYKFRWKSLWYILGIAVLITLADQISTEIFKKGFERLRPSRTPELEGLVHIVNNYRGGKYGFVSSHAANSFAVAVFFSLTYRGKWFCRSMFAWACLVSYSRIYLGVHYPGDILGGAIIGTLLAFTVYFLLQLLLRKLYQQKRI